MIDSHTLDVLEFNRVLEIISSYSSSELGKEEVLATVPSDQPENIERELDLTSELIDILRFDDPLPTQGIRDIRPILAKIAKVGATLDSEDLFPLKDFLTASRLIQGYISSRSEKYPSLNRELSEIRPYKELEQKISSIVDENGRIRDSASPLLRRIRSELTSSRERLREKLNKLLDSLPEGVLSDRIITIRDGRYVIPVRDSQKNRVGGLIHDRSDSGATVFVEPISTLERNNRIRELELSERREIERILRDLTADIQSARDGITGNLGTLKRFDYIYSKASFAVDFGANVPILNTEGNISLKKGRHPLLVHRHRGEDYRIVPLDIELGADFDVLVITGPNAGGKTVALKTVGLITLMAQSGIPVTAGPESEVAIFGKIFADIGDEQSIESDLSTFSSHVRQLVKVCHHSDSDTLALLDEIGAGTDPELGSALAISVLELLAGSGVKTIATTHHGALKLFAHSHNRIRNGSMQIEPETLQPTFVFRPGLPGSSYTFEIARKLGIPEEVILRAERRSGPGTKKLEDLIADLSKSYIRYSEEMRRHEEARTKLEGLVSEYEEKLRSIRKEERKLKKEALEASRKILSEANALIERTVTDLRRSKAEKESIKKARLSIADSSRKVEEEIRAMEEVSYRKPDNLEQGDTVWLEDVGLNGKVVKIDGEKGEVQVQAGSAKLTMPIEGLRKVASKKAEDRATVSIRTPSASKLSPELEIRGMTFDEAMPILDKYLDDAYLARLERVTIIHGKGTGALREKVGKFLKGHPRVKSQRLGAWNEGSDGVTIVDIKD